MAKEETSQGALNSGLSTQQMPSKDTEIGGPSPWRRLARGKHRPPQRMRVRGRLSRFQVHTVSWVSGQGRSPGACSRGPLHGRGARGRLLSLLHGKELGSESLDPLPQLPPRKLGVGGVRGDKAVSWLRGAWNVILQ